MFFEVMLYRKVYILIIYTLIMKVLESRKEKKKMVRILIGNTETGSKSIKAPIKTITLMDTNVLEIYEALIKFFKEME